MFVHQKIEGSAAGTATRFQTSMFTRVGSMARLSMSSVP
jgi:hypothetical protein